MILRARVVVTMDGPPIDNGAVVISENRILDVGAFSEICARHSGEVIDLGEQVLLPGLINAHCHLDYTCLRRKIPRQRSFADWVRAINAEKANLSPNDYVASMNDGFAEAKRFGTTTIANLTAFPELIAKIPEPIRCCWFAELIDVRDPSRALEIVDRAVEQLQSTLECAGRTRRGELSKRSGDGRIAALQKQYWGLAPHAPYTASVNLYRCCGDVARRENGLLTTHLAESREEMSMFRSATGPLHEFLQSIGRDMSDCGKATPLANFVGATGRRALPSWIVTHLNEMTATDFELLPKSKQKFSIAHCPRSHKYFGHSPFQFEKLNAIGVNVCLGTDSLASNDDLSLFAEMRTFQEEFPGVGPEDVLKTVTTNAARALRQEDVLGKIAPGFVADLIALPIERSTSIFQEIIEFGGAVHWMMIGGDVL